MWLVERSTQAIIGDTSTGDPINIFCQFFVAPTDRRNAEIKLCLKKNVDNPDVTRIYLLNEREYTDAELGVTSYKIVQVNLGRRLKFSDVFAYIANTGIIGYNVIVNSDIFVDETIGRLRYSDIHVAKKMFALLRYDWENDTAAIYGPRMDSQDTWIVHSNHNPTEKARKVFTFEFGKPGCDNKMTFLMKILGFEVINDPMTIKTFHVHSSQERTYTVSERILSPYSLIIPYGYEAKDISPQEFLGLNISTVVNYTRNFTRITFDDNRVLHDYIKGNLDRREPFIIPRIAGIENDVAVFTKLYNDGRIKPVDFRTLCERTIGKMKNNAGIHITSHESLLNYSKRYLRAFEHAEVYAGWESHGGVYKYYKQSIDYIMETYQKRVFYAPVFDVFNYIHSLPWTFALRGKRILIISAFEDTIREVLPHHDKIFGVNLFPECHITTMRPPQTQGAEESRDVEVELAEFCKRLDTIKDTYDVALVSCGGYGNLVCDHIYQSGRSAVYVGGVLQMYFGILGSRWLKDCPDIVRMYLNEYWRRPKDSEKPLNFKAVENACYW